MATCCTLVIRWQFSRLWIKTFLLSTFLSCFQRYLLNFVITVQLIIKLANFCDAGTYSELVMLAHTQNSRCFLSLTIFAKSSILDVWQGSEYASASGDVDQSLHQPLQKCIQSLISVSKEVAVYFCNLSAWCCVAPYTLRVSSTCFFSLSLSCWEKPLWLRSLYFH